MDPLDKKLIDLLKVNARLPVVKLAQALGCARSTVLLRMKALEQGGIISGYTISVAQPTPAGVQALVLIATDSSSEASIIQALSRRHEVTKVYSVNGRYDLCAQVHTDSLEEFDAVINRLRGIKGVTDTMSTMILSTKLDRPD
ncbi:regulatory protein AsnC [Rhodoferax lithotrophicus]|uniref:Regulatory protein AsnC n=1 Tax=Rhodoferax lithotrophicus TaxID=2798804 RepID=A0ABM7MIT8_9BURK|nr:Lrp/AsnC family transcriptional regulator [Rhodoferax sp. MIZ03]BCO26177.1 regulatory protein AsnC [Rhodoferax sp. MIZ03]